MLPLLQADREALSAQLSSMEDWLYDEGEDETKSTYVAKLAELKAKGDPIEARAADDASRPGKPSVSKRLSTAAPTHTAVACCSYWWGPCCLIMLKMHFSAGFACTNWWQLFRLGTHTRCAE